MKYHKLTKVFSQLANTNPRLNIWDRISIISNVNEYLMANEYKIKELENQVKNITNELTLLKNTQLHNNSKYCIGGSRYDGCDKEDR